MEDRDKEKIIAELKLSHELLEAERLKFAGFFNQAPVGYFVLDYIGSIVEANQTGADLLGTDKINLPGKRFQSYIATQDLENFYRFLYDMKDAGKRQNFEVKLLLDHENEIYTRMEGVAVPNEFPDKIQYYLTVVDTTESRLAQQQLLDTTERLKITLSASSTGTWTMEAGQNRIFLDDFACTILELKPGNFDGSIYKFIELGHADDHKGLRDAFLSPQNAGDKIELEFRLKSSNQNPKIIYAFGQKIEGPGDSHYFAGILMDITLRRELIRQAEDAQEANQKLVLSATFSAQEKERDRISSALHDSICQILYGIRLNVQNIQLVGAGNEMITINKLLDQAIQETREISYELTPSVLRDFGFVAGIKEISQRFSSAGLTIKAEIDGELDALPSDTQLYLFRIVQELISNCIKHSGATTLLIHIFLDENWLTLLTQDDGGGFDAEASQVWLKGSGLRGIKNRVRLLNGEMQIKSTPAGSVTTIRIKK